MYDISENILNVLKQYNGQDKSDFQYHYDIIKSYVKDKKTILAIIPAFPGKAINPNLCPSNIPDGAEEYAVNLLKKITTDIQKIYKPGIHIKIFHDGYYFIPLGMDYDYYRMQEYVDIIRKMCKDYSISSIDMKDTTEGSTFEARLNYWQFYNTPTNDEIQKFMLNNKDVYTGLLAFFFNNYSSYLYPLESRNFRKKISEFIAHKYISINLGVQKYIDNTFPNYLRLSVKRQNNLNSHKLYIDLLKGIKNEGLPWMNTLVKDGDELIIQKFRKDVA